MSKVIDQYITDDVALYNSDCVEGIRGLPDNSVHFSVYSPPFSSLYTYTALPEDFGNCRSDEEFFAQYKFLVKELYRVLKPGRLMAVHCMNLATLKSREGYIGIRDFRGDLIRSYQDAGFIYHSEICIWKDPVVAMQRTKALGLLHKQLKKDSAMSRQGFPDYIVVMRKPGDNDEPVWHYGSEKELVDDAIESGKVITDQDRNRVFPVGVWQNYASPVWMDIDQGETLNRDEAREEDDERHICPLQLEVIKRCLKLWTNPGDVVLTPFAGIGSELYVSVKNGRKAIGFELKEQYYKTAVKNIKAAVESLKVRDLFSDIEDGRSDLDWTNDAIHKMITDRIVPDYEKKGKSVERFSIGSLADGNRLVTISFADGTESKFKSNGWSLLTINSDDDDNGEVYEHLESTMFQSNQEQA